MKLKTIKNIELCKYGGCDCSEKLLKNIKREIRNWIKTADRAVKEHNKRNNASPQAEWFKTKWGKIYYQLYHSKDKVIFSGEYGDEVDGIPIINIFFGFRGDKK